MAQYAPLRDAFHELNRLLIDKQQWDGEHSLRQQEMGLKRQMMEQQTQDAALKRKSLQVEAAEAERLMAPSRINVWEYVPDSAPMREMLLNKDPQTARNIAKVFGGTNIDPTTGFVINEDNQPVEMPTRDKTLRSSGAMAFVMSAIDPSMMVDANLAKLQEMQSAKKSELNKLPNHPLNAEKRGRISAELAAIQGEIGKQNTYKTPENMIKALEQQQAVVNQWAMKASTDGATSAFMDTLKGQQNNINQRILNYKTMQLESERQKHSEKLEAGRQAHAEKMEGIRQTNAKSATNEVPVQKTVYKTNADGSVESRVLTFTKKDLIGKAARPMDVAPNLDESWSWASEKQETPKTINKGVWENDVAKKIALGFSMKGDLGTTGGIPIDPDKIDRNRVAESLWAKAAPKYRGMKDADLDQIPTATIARAVKDMADLEVNNYYEAWMKIYHGKGGENREETAKIAKQLLDPKFYEQHGTVPNSEFNVYAPWYQPFSQTHGDPGVNSAGFDRR